VNRKSSKIIEISGKHASHPNSSANLYPEGKQYSLNSSKMLNSPIRNQNKMFPNIIRIEGKL
jgi:hypothetical protein